MTDFLPTPERQKQILFLLARQRRLSVTEIVKQFSISEATAPAGFGIADLAGQGAACAWRRDRSGTSSAGTAHPRAGK